MAIFENIAVPKLTYRIHYTLSSDKNGYSLQRLVAKMGLVVAIYWLIWPLCGEPLQVQTIFDLTLSFDYLTLSLSLWGEGMRRYYQNQ